MQIKSMTEYASLPGCRAKDDSPAVRSKKHVGLPSNGQFFSGGDRVVLSVDG